MTEAAERSGTSAGTAVARLVPRDAGGGGGWRKGGWDVRE